MPSLAYQNWTTTRAAALDEIERAHGSIRREGAGWRWAAQQLNQGYVVLLCSHFQGFCRELHDECAKRLVASLVPPTAQEFVEAVFVLNRRLDIGNPNAGNLGADFGRFGLVLWVQMQLLDDRTEARRDSLEVLIRRRNAIAHQDSSPPFGVGTVLRLQEVRAWRQTCHQLAGTMDQVMRRHLQTVAGHPPW
jgi:hypothetical protein